MLYSIVIHPDAQADLATLMAGTANDRLVAATVLALIQELNGNESLLDSLTDEGFGSDKSGKFEVKKWQELWRKKKDVWRLKLWDLDRAGCSYRVIYAYEIAARRYHVLGVFPRSFNYEQSSPLTKRIVGAFDAL